MENLTFFLSWKRSWKNTAGAEDWASVCESDAPCVCPCVWLAVAAHIKRAPILLYSSTEMWCIETTPSVSQSLFSRCVLSVCVKKNEKTLTWHHHLHNNRVSIVADRCRSFPALVLTHPPRLTPPSIPTYSQKISKEEGKKKDMCERWGNPKVCSSHPVI
jgi:hypothetical protein